MSSRSQKLLEEIAWQRRLEDLLLAVFSDWGYREVRTPAWEDLEEVQGNGQSFHEMCKLLDPEGRLLALRPDMTWPIARLVTSRLSGEPRPLRLAYAAPLFRRDPEGRSFQELTQAGAELIGSSAPAGDLEILLLADACMQTLNLEYRLVLGHAGRLRSLLAKAGLTEPDDIEAVWTSLRQQDFVGLRNQLVRCLSAESAQALIDALEERLTPEDALGKEEDETDWSRLLQAISQFPLKERVVVEAGLVRERPYYTGLVFEIYIEGVGKAVGGGGRYDRLLESWGEEAPATGFALFLDLLAPAAQKSLAASMRQTVDWLIAGSRDQLAVIWREAHRLRATGASVMVDPGSNSKSELMKQAEKLDAEHWLWIGNAERVEGRVGQHE